MFLSKRKFEPELNQAFRPNFVFTENAEDKGKVKCHPKGTEKSGIWDILQGNWPVFFNNIILKVEG